MHDDEHVPVQTRYDVVCSCSIKDRRGRISWTAEHYEREAVRKEPRPALRRTPWPEGKFDEPGSRST